MICPKCGKETLNNATFCTNCGTKLKSSVPPHEQAQSASYYQQQTQNNYQQSSQNYQQPSPGYQQPNQNYYQQPVQGIPLNAENPSATKALVFGIIAICLCWFPIASIILGAFAIKFGNQTVKNANQGFNKRSYGTASKILGIISIIICSLLTLYWIISAIIAIVLIFSAASGLGIGVYY